MTAALLESPCRCEDVQPLDCHHEAWCEAHNLPERSACTHSLRCEPCQTDRCCGECKGDR